jgi:hypothetical protein
MLRFNYCLGRSVFKFIVPLSAFTAVRCTKAGEACSLKVSVFYRAQN